MSTPPTDGHRRRSDTVHADRSSHPAAPTGAYVAITGIVVFVVATFVDRVSTIGADPTSGTGYETDTVIPLLSWLGIGLAIALLYAISRARGRQHRGLSLVTMAVGIAAVGIALSYVFDAPGAFERGADLDTEAGVWVALIGGVIWSIGGGLLAKENEGDDDWRPTSQAVSDRP